MIMMRVHRHGGYETFIADELERDGGTWTARGRWRFPSSRYSEPASYTWPTHKVHEIRWDFTEPGA